MDKPLIHFDKRIVDRSIRKSELTQEEFDNFINTLPDRTDDAEPLDLEEEAKIAAPPPPPAADTAPAEDVPADPAPEAAAPPGPDADAFAAPPVETDVSEALAGPPAEDEASAAEGEKSEKSDVPQERD